MADVDPASLTPGESLPPDEAPHPPRAARRPGARTGMVALTLGALGVVFGDIGTSPLYALREAARAAAHGGTVTPDAILGIVSLIFWALILIISIKYALLILRADNHGEGGILALMSMTGANWSEGGRVLIVMGLFGAALLYGDGIITPAISVLSALEGVNLVTDATKPYVLPALRFCLLCSSSNLGAPPVSAASSDRS